MDSGPGLTIVLLGNTGVGKSASGNTILGRPAFVSRRAFTSVTKEISDPTTETVFGKQVSVIDTPGILGSEGKIQELLQSTRPGLILVVVKVDRFTIEQKNAADAAIRVIGDQFNNSYLLFTGGDDLDSQTLDEFIDEDPEGQLKALVQRFEERYHVFNNKTEGQEQVRELLEKSGHLTNAAPPTKTRRIVLLGLPGGGKSSSGNTILGSNQFESASSFNSVTTETVAKSAIVEGRQVKVMDTPGFTREVMSPRKLFEEIMKSVREAQPGPHAFIIVVKIDRISEAEGKLLKMLPKLFSSDASKYVMVLFTRADELEGQRIERVIRDNRFVSDLVSRCGDRYCVFDNTKRGNRVQVTELLDKIDTMVTANEEKHYTSEMFYDVQNITVKISIKWHKLGKWFTQKLQELDAHRRERRGYANLNDIAVGEDFEISEPSIKNKNQ